MQTQQLVVSRSEARDLYRSYKEHKHYSTTVDKEVQRAYQLLAQGRLIIRALESIKAAGLNGNGLPMLAIAPADVGEVRCTVGDSGAAMFDARARRPWWQSVPDRIIAQRAYFAFPRGTFPATKRTDGRARLPMIPLPHRPQRRLANYHVLWEAEWSLVPARDPMLLRRIGKADLWLVLAAWDLAPAEIAALATRM